MKPRTLRGARRTAPGLAALFACAVIAAAPARAQGPAAPQGEKKDAMDKPAEKSADKPADKKEVAVIKTNMGTIVFEFLPDVAPKMVDNFKDLARTGFYDGTTFHRVISGFMIQGGDPLSKDDDPSNDGTGSGPRRMPAEFTDKYSHRRGMVSTARSSDPNSGSCQFFIMHRDNTGLDRQYTIFGRVIDGMATVDKIAAVRTSKPGDRPLQAVVMEKVTIETR
jgi:peptidyl-prolyl cis-trans isomerase B (cyclophilin B)